MVELQCIILVLVKGPTNHKVGLGYFFNEAKAFLTLTSNWTKEPILDFLQILEGFGGNV